MPPLFVQALRAPVQALGLGAFSLCATQGRGHLLELFGLHAVHAFEVDQPGRLAVLLQLLDRGQHMLVRRLQLFLQPRRGLGGGFLPLPQVVVEVGPGVGVGDACGELWGQSPRN